MEAWEEQWREVGGATGWVMDMEGGPDEFPEGLVRGLVDHLEVMLPTKKDSLGRVALRLADGVRIEWETVWLGDESYSTEVEKKTEEGRECSQA